MAELKPQRKNPTRLYRIGHTDDSSRDPLFTLSKQKAMNFLVRRLAK